MGNDGNIDGMLDNQILRPLLMNWFFLTKFSKHLTYYSFNFYGTHLN